jgi:MarR family transcriptional regulator, organic hydroperoxide resistance regulator
MTAAATPRAAAVEDVRAALGELLGADRRLRGRDRPGPSGLSHGEVRALFALAREPEMTAGAIARAADLNPATVTGMLDHLEERGVLRRRRDADDRRRVVVSLTDEGAKLLAEKRERWLGCLESALAEVPDAEVAAAAGVMRRLAALLDAL